MRNLRLTLGALLALALPSLPAAERNIVFFITDDESPTLGCYGDKTAVSPQIDALAADGTVFLRASATTASCSASRSVVMSGLHNHANGQYGHAHDFHKFSSWDNVVSLALPRVLANCGYRTAQAGKYHVAPEEVYHFETYLKSKGDRNPVELAEAAREFITAADDRPFFLYIGAGDPHRGGGQDESYPGPLKPDLFGNKKNKGSFPGVTEVFFDPAKVAVPEFLPDTPECRSELAHYYQSCARVDQGVGRILEILKEAGLYDKTLFVFTSDHGMAFPGGKTTVYEPGLHVPFVVRNPYEAKRGVRSNALISHIDITPSLLDFAGGLDPIKNAPKAMISAEEYWKDKPYAVTENRGPRKGLDRYHGKSWLPALSDPDAKHWDAVFASHTFHEIQMYYPMRAVRDDEFKLIWNIAHPLPFPFASDLWSASTWQAQWEKGLDAPYGKKTVGGYVHRPAFELYHLKTDPSESVNLAGNPEYAAVLKRYQETLKTFQKDMGDPWIQKWDYE
jgi:N-sulfoglucosamine sulfohydrolase